MESAIVEGVKKKKSYRGKGQYTLMCICYFFHRHLLRTYYVPGTVLGIGIDVEEKNPGT